MPMVYNMGHTKNEKTNIENFKDDTISAHCIPMQSV